MSAPPKTVLHATEDEEKAIRAAVREARGLDTIGGALVRPTDACEFSEFLADPAVSDPIYDLPRPFTETIVRAWIEERVERRMSGEALLSLTRDANGRILSFANVDVWPARSSAELAGAMRVDQQNSGRRRWGAACVGLDI
jgi:hypothetical protein